MEIQVLKLVSTDQRTIPRSKNWQFLTPKKTLLNSQLLLVSLSKKLTIDRRFLKFENQEFYLRSCSRHFKTDLFRVIKNLCHIKKCSIYQLIRVDCYFSLSFARSPPFKRDVQLKLQPYNILAIQGLRHIMTNTCLKAAKPYETLYSF